MSKNSVIQKYEISDASALKRWINHHNSGKELTATSSGRVGATMGKGRSTTLKERIEIAEFTLARDKDYESAMEKFKVSYQQVYSWVNKYEKSGADGLLDGRSRNKSVEELTETELLQLRIKELETRNEFLEMQGAFEKKLMELKQRYDHFH